MENSEKIDKRKRIDKIILTIYIFLISAGLLVSMYYNYTLENQINERDNLIHRLTVSDSILNQILEIKEDSVTQTRTWEYLKKNGKVLKYNELNKLLSKSDTDYNKAMIEMQGFIDELNSTTQQNKILNDSLALIEAVFHLLKSKYDLELRVEVKESSTYITIEAKKIDSALLLLPHYRNKIIFNSEKQKWYVLIDQKK
jgi:hypothetical protein